MIDLPKSHLVEEELNLSHWIRDVVMESCPYEPTEDEFLDGLRQSRALEESHQIGCGHLSHRDAHRLENARRE